MSLHTVERLSVYRRMLEELSHEGVEFVHSHQLAGLVGVTAAQLRRDLASFGSFGNIARGYNVRDLDRTIGRIIGTDITQAVALFGLGDLGRALLSYRGFEERGFNIAAIFETDPEKVGRVFAGRRCYGLDDLETVVADHDIRIAVLASRPEGLQAVVDQGRRRGCAVVPQLRPQPGEHSPRLLRGAHRYLGQVGEAFFPQPPRHGDDVRAAGRRKRARRA